MFPTVQRIDAILLDLSLPDSHGLNSFSQVHAKVPQVPVIVLTGTNDDAIALEMMRAGAQDYLVKGETDSRLLVKTIHYAIERSKVAKALDESERMLSTVMSRTPGVVFRCKNDPDWTMEYVSDGMRDICGYAADEFIHNRLRSFISIVEPEDRAVVTAEIKKALDTRQPYVIEYRINTATGDQRWVAERGSATFSDDNELIVREGLLIDVTRRRKAEEALKQREEQFQALVEKSADVISLYNKEGQRTYISPAITNILGYSVEEYIAQDPHWLFHPDDSSPAEARRVYLETHPGEALPVTRRIRHKDGSWRWIEGSIRNLTEEPDIQSVVINFHDITERKLAEEALRESENKFRDLAEKSSCRHLSCSG